MTNLHRLEEPLWPPENFCGLAELRLRGQAAIATVDSGMFNRQRVRH